MKHYCVLLHSDAIYLNILQRILDDVSTSLGTPLSGHYGIQVTIQNTREDCNTKCERKRYFCLDSPRPLFLSLVTPNADLGRLCLAVQDK